MKKNLTAALCALLLLALVISCATTAAPDDSGLTNAKNYLAAMYGTGSKVTATASDYKVVDVVMVNNVAFPVSWTADTDEVTFSDAVNHMITVDVNEKASEDVYYTLTATITDSASGNTSTAAFAHYIPAFRESTWTEYRDAADDTTLVVKGVVTGIMSKTNGNSSNCLYFQDDTAGYYIYAMADDPVTLGIEPGMTVRATGQKDTYSGTLELANASVEILDAEKKTVEPVDFTALYENASSLKDASITGPQALYVTIKDVTVTTQDISSGYYRFKKGDLESYVRISSSVCPITKDLQSELKSSHAEHFGWVADVSGVICVYDGAFYLSPVDGSSFVYKGLPEKSDAEKIAFELEALDLPEAITEDTVASLSSKGVSYDTVAITWESDSACALVDGGKLSFTLPEEDTVVTITAIASCGTETAERTFTVKVDAAPKTVFEPLFVSEPEEHKIYALALYQGNTGRNLYFTGELSGKYLATTDKGDKAAPVYAEKTADGLRLYFIKDRAKSYIEIVPADGKATIQLNSEPTAVWTWNSDVCVPVTNVDGTDYYLGCYKTYETISASKTSYILDDTSVIGKSQFPATLAELGIVSDIQTKATEAADGEYLFRVNQNNAGKVLYVTGEMSGKYLATVINPAKAATVTVENKDGGFTMKTDNGCIEIADVGGKATIQVNSEPTALWKWNSDACVPVMNVAGTDYYLGCYKTYETVSASKSSYILDDTSVIDVSQFPATLYETEKVTLVKCELSEAVEGIHKLGLEQNNIGKMLYFTGEMNGKYLATSTDVTRAADVTLKTADGGFTLSSGSKFIEIVSEGGKATIKLSDESSVLWNMDPETGVMYTSVDGTDYYLGCYKTYDTLSASKTGYVLDDTSVIGASQFPLRLLTFVNAE
ncbi:MAG: immunoglobulin-like domain-containing protein [Bullifex sp.]